MNLDIWLKAPAFQTVGNSASQVTETVYLAVTWCTVDLFVRCLCYAEGVTYIYVRIIDSSHGTMLLCKDRLLTERQTDERSS